MTRRSWRAWMSCPPLRCALSSSERPAPLRLRVAPGRARLCNLALWVQSCALLLLICRAPLSTRLAAAPLPPVSAAPAPQPRRRPSAARREGLHRLTQLIFSKAQPKRLGSQILSGPMLAGLTEAYVTAINNGWAGKAWELGGAGEGSRLAGWCPCFVLLGRRRCFVCGLAAVWTQPSLLRWSSLGRGPVRLQCGAHHRHGVAGRGRGGEPAGG